MKLYATITSERASESQGGNDFLNIEIYRENKEKVADIVLSPSTDTKDNIVISIEHNPTRATLFFPKGESEVIDFLEGVQDYKEGEKLKGEIKLCKSCRYIQAVNLNKEGYCEDCWRDLQRDLQ